MIGGLVMGAVEKLYRQPLFSPILYSTSRCLYISSPRKDNKKGALTSPPKWFMSDCAFSRPFIVRDRHKQMYNPSRVDSLLHA